ncbi:hypothetical protein HK097_010980 [Rhizophlyctis rosea]|uniref:Uncharacterized protein n=1 Tax=Rhizophlyctis rosea TaxID=64517 RepID=A0AAD5S8B1_9FUNG|nr:hypothetical protein HK097_010980 [Rhizophlyctis rosea]
MSLVPVKRKVEEASSPSWKRMFDPVGFTSVSTTPATPVARAVGSVTPVAKSVASMKPRGIPVGLLNLAKARQQKK